MTDEHEVVTHTEFEIVRQRMGWRFPWVSSYGSDFNYGPGGEDFLGAYRILDVMPKGRNETGPYHTLADWARPRNMYGKGGSVEANGRYHAPACHCTVHRE